MAYVVPVAAATTYGVADKVIQLLDHAEDWQDDDTAYARWRSVANGNQRVELTKEAYEEVLHSVEHPREPNERLRAAMARHGQLDV
jgi:predicted RNA-binding Zn ribbon-like protein